ADLPAGTTMVLYTDGLAERPGERLASRRARIAEAAAGAPDPESVCSRLLARLLDGGRPDDDVVLLAVQAMPAPEDALLCTVPALAEELLPLRRQLRRWLAARGANEREIAAITLATQEACANAVEHAYGLADATFHLAAVHDGPRVLFGAIRRLGRRQQELRLVIDRESLVADLVTMTDMGSYAGVDLTVGDAVERLAIAPV